MRSMELKRKDYAVPTYYLMNGTDGVYPADAAFELLDDHDSFETYYLAAAIKYGVRAGNKTDDPEEDLRKLRMCLVRAIEHHERRTHVEADR